MDSTRNSRQKHKTVKVKLGKVFMGHVSPVLLCEVESEEIQQIFWNIYPRIENCKHILINHKYVPHITLFWFEKRRRQIF